MKPINRRKKFALLSLTLLMTCSVALGCARSDSAPITEGFNAAIDLKPKKPVAKQETFFGVSITEKSADKEIEGATVTMFLEMKDMDHGENKILLQEPEPGRYTGQATFPMEGAWIAHIRVEKDGQSSTNNVELNVIK